MQCTCDIRIHTYVFRKLTPAVHSSPGVSIGGIYPLVYSILGDLFGEDQHMVMSALIQTSMGLGVGLG